jgi:virginiamycin B lyase
VGQRLGRERDPALRSKTEKFEPFPLPDQYAGVRQLAGRKGEVWGAESGADKLFVLKAE